MRILSITPLALLCLALFSGSPVVADEYVMRCYDYKQHQTSFYKLVDTLINKKLFYRSLGEWREMCIDKYDTFYHKGDGAVCKTKVQDEKDRCKGTGTYKLCIIDQIRVYDFYTYKYSHTRYENGIPSQTDLSCYKVE